MKNYVTCSQQDYDFYTIPFPLSALKKDRRNKYVYSELAKRHPCFSDDCCFDTKFHMEKTGLKADVVVMQKIRLAEYKAKSRKIYIEERKRIPFFMVHKSDKNIFVVIALLFVFITLLFLKSVVQRKKGAKEKEAIVSEELPPVNMSLSPHYNCILLQAVCEAGGTILHFEWKTDGFTEYTTLTVKGVFPEQLLHKTIDVSFSSVVFEDGVPLMTVNLTEKIQASDFLQAQDDLIRTDFRTFVLQNGALIIQETVSPYGMNIVIPVNIKQPQNEVLCSIIDFLISNEMSVSGFSINQNEDLMNVAVEFLSVKTAAFVAVGNELLQQKELFQNKSKQVLMQQVSVEKNQSHPLQEQQDKLTKIGQVTKPDGKTITFYKNEEGKIISSQGR